MVMEKPSPLLVGREFVRQYYTLLNQAPDMLHRFYGKNSSYVHGGLDSNGKPADAVYGQKEIHRKVMSQNFTNCHTKIRHVDAHATLNDGVVVQVMGLLSNNNQALRRFMQTFVLAPEGVKAVLAESYEKIHKDHLIGIGIAPLQFLPGESADSLGLSGRETFSLTFPEELSPGVTLNIKTSTGKVFSVIASFENDVEITLYKHGGLLNFVARKFS